MQALYAPLYSFNNGNIEWGLAESLTPSADNLSYTLTLKPNLKWQDGQPLTADDVVFTFNKLLDAKQHSFFRSMFTWGGKPVEVSKVDDRTVKFTLPQVSAAFTGTWYRSTRSRSTCSPVKATWKRAAKTMRRSVPARSNLKSTAPGSITP
jgi:peptide/nickel transport system substrate-binding protein